MWLETLINQRGSAGGGGLEAHLGADLSGMPVVHVLVWALLSYRAL